MAYIVMAYIVMAYIVVAYIVMAYIVMAYIVMAIILRSMPTPRSITLPSAPLWVRARCSMHARARVCACIRA